MTALVLDFDGTITDEDFFVYLKEAYFDDNALAPWRQYLNGDISHFEALRQMFGMLRIPVEELDALISTVKVDDWVRPLFELCYKMGVPMYIASAGCDYYIKRILGKEINKYNITLVTNGSTYTQKAGLKITAPPEDSQYYNKDVGISKRAVVEGLVSSDYDVVFAGDGPPDIEPAIIATHVFAKKMLLEACKERGINTLPFDSCLDIYNFLKRSVAV